MPTSYFVNVNFICNERCIFCAADLADGTTRVDERRRLHLDELKAWLGEELPGPTDRVSIAGGEPTLHRELFDLIRHLAQRGPHVILFTNGLRFADRGYAVAALDAGVTQFEIALFGASAAAHDAITRRPGSFEQTLKALNVLGALRADRQFHLDLRLLVSRQTVAENPRIVHVVSDRVGGVDSISLHRLILSEDARVADATVSWAEARPSINETARLIREFGYELRHESLPFCVFDGDNADYVRQKVRDRLDGPAESLVPFTFRYLDPVSAAGQPMQSFGAERALPVACTKCDYLPLCGRVERWYVERFGTAGIQPMRLDVEMKVPSSAT